eukprot:g30918.t1
MPSMYLAWLSLVTVVAGAFAELQRRNATPVTPVTVQNPEEIQVVKQTVQVLQSSRSSEGTEKPNLSLPVLNLTLRSAAPVERSERSSVAGEAEWCKGNWRASYQWSPPRRRRQAAPAPAPNAPAAPWVGPIPVSPTGGCKSSRIPLDSKCKGCPPKKDSRDFRRTTELPREYTAAMNCANLDTDPAKSWCPVNCGQCYKLCTTGGATQGRSPKPGVCRIFKITNRCGDGYDDHTPDWCSQHMSWQD